MNTGIRVTTRFVATPSGDRVCHLVTLQADEELASGDVEVEVRIADPRVAEVSTLQAGQMDKAADGIWRTRLHDFFATTPRSFGLVLHLVGVEALSETPLGEIEIEATWVGASRVRHGLPALRGNRR